MATYKLIRRLTHCNVPGHGTNCLAVWERGNSWHEPGIETHSRCTEERLALEFELQADYDYEGSTEADAGA